MVTHIGVMPCKNTALNHGKVSLVKKENYWHNLGASSQYLIFDTWVYQSANLQGRMQQRKISVCEFLQAKVKVDLVGLNKPGPSQEGVHYKAVLHNKKGEVNRSICEFALVKPFPSPGNFDSINF